ncbi:MAG TPA: DUF4173 domain-containing protein, partial [Allosphingosinicella sp.]
MEAVEQIGKARQAPGRFTFVQKPLAALGFMALADILFYWERIGTTLGFFFLSLLAFALIVRPDIVRDRDARAAAAGAGVFGLVAAYDPSLLVTGLFLVMLTLAILLPRTRGFDDGWRWAQRLGWHWLRAPLAPLRDWSRVRAAGARRSLGLWRNSHVLALPLLGSLIFLSLFAVANPLIGGALAGIDLNSLFGGLYVTRILFWLVVLAIVWSVLRPGPMLLLAEREGSADVALPGVGMRSLTLSFLAFNAVFALNNVLDIAFLWSGAPLPQGMTLAAYAHRGAYPLIATALLAALFVLVTLRPGSETASNPLIRRLVYAWIAQNVLLVASTMLRTFDYIEAYSLTRLRIAALIWMGLVAIGLFLICYRIWKSKSGSWLINANLAASLIALGFCSVADLGRMAAAWNVRHAREAGGAGADLDTCYLRGLGASALLPMIELEGRTRDPGLRQRIGWARIDTMQSLRNWQGNWRGWTMLGALRLQAAEEAVARRRLPPAYGPWRDCDKPLDHQP